jgi:fibronectin-binding autotransporter adhesin
VSKAALNAGLPLQGYRILKRRRGRWAALAGAAGAVSLAALPAYAINTDNWKGGSSNWNSTGNWSSGIIPAAGDIVNVTGTNGLSFAVTYDFPGSLTLGTLTIDLTNSGSTGSATLTMTGNTLASVLEYVGVSGVGLLKESAGINNVVGGTLALGQNTGSTGTYLLSGTGSLGSTGSEILGNGGVGTLTQTGGNDNLTSGASVYLGSLTSGQGFYNLISGGLSLVGGGSEFVGNQGTGTFTQSGGSNNASLLSVGAVAGSSGTYILNGLSHLTVTNEYIGSGGKGVFTQTNGQNICGNEVDLGRSSGSVGSYTIGGTGASLVAEGSMYIGGSSGGAGGAGTLTVNAGATVGAGSILSIYAGTANSINLSGGTIAAGTFNFNNNFSQFHWNSGTLEVTGSNEIIDSTAIANLTSSLTLGSGQNLIVSSNEYVGGDGTGAGGGSGMVTQTGGGNTIFSGSLALGSNPGTTGTYALSGTGSVSVPTEVIGNLGSGTMNHSAGTNDATTSLILGQNSGGTGTYNLSNTGSVVALSEYIGGGPTTTAGGVGTFNQTGGTNTVAGSGAVFAIGSGTGSGTFTISGGVTSITGDGYDGSSLDTYAPNGKGTLTVTGSGLFQVSGTLHVLNGSGSVINLQGGEIETGALDLQGNYAQLNWMAGTLALTNTNVTLDSTITNSTSNPLGAALSLAGGQSLFITGTQTIGGAGPGSLTLGAGSTEVVTGAITLNSDGVLNQNGGSLTFGSFVQAGGDINGTLQNAGTFTYQNGNFNGRLINDGTVNLGNNFTAANGIENDSSMTVGANQMLTVNGQGLDNLGTLNLLGTIGGSGTILNDFGGILNAQGGTISSGLTNDGTVNLNGLLTATSGTNTNYGLIWTGSATFRSTNMNNFGVINLGGGAITGAISNSAGGLIEGRGGLSGALTNNAGGVLDANSTVAPLVVTNFQGNNAGSQIEVANGATMEINNAWTNLGLVSMLGSGSILGGANFINTGTIDGQGEITGVVTNNDVIRADGGQLMLASGLSNPAAGQLQAATGDTLFVASGFTSNAGEIALSGGTFDDNNQLLTNTSSGQIVGSGTFRSGGLTNQGTISFADEAASVYGSLTTASVGAGTGVVNITNNTTTFYGPVTIGTLTTFNVNQATARFLSGFTNNGTYHTDPSTTITTNLAVGSLGAIIASTGDLYQVSGNYTNASSQSGTWSTSGAELEFTGGGTHQLTVTGTTAYSPWGTLAIDSGNTVMLTAGNHTTTVNALQLTGSGTLDVTNNGIAIDYAGQNDPAATVASNLAKGYAGGTWTGMGITSSTAAAGVAAASSPLLSVGYADGNVDSGTTAAANQVLVKFTLAGDALLNGTVNFNDLDVVGQHLNTTGNDWAEGNFTYDPNGAVTFNDLDIIGQNLNTALGALGSSAIASGGTTVPLEATFQVENTVPEPGSIALVISGGLLARRRSRKRIRNSEC